MPIVAATKDSIDRAAEALAKGEIVAFPTETVYGLGANALNAAAIAKVFAARDRPRFNPLIVHVLGLEEAEACAVVNDTARKARCAPSGQGPVSGAAAQIRLRHRRSRQRRSRHRRAPRSEPSRSPARLLEAARSCPSPRRAPTAPAG